MDKRLSNMKLHGSVVPHKKDIDELRDTSKKEVFLRPPASARAFCPRAVKMSDKRQRKCKRDSALAGTRATVSESSTKKILSGAHLAGAQRLQRHGYFNLRVQKRLTVVVARDKLDHPECHCRLHCAEARQRCA